MRDTFSERMIRVAGRRGQRMRKSEETERTDITPYWGPIYSVVVPYDGVNEAIEACQTSPKRITGCPDVPGFDER